MALIVWIVASVAVAIAGPFGTFDQFSLGTRLLYWFVVVAVSVVLGRAVRLTIENLFAQYPSWLMEMASLTVMVPLLSIIIWLISHGLPRDMQTDVPSIWRMAMFVFFVAAPVAVFRRLWGRAKADSLSDSGEQPRLLDRLPEDLRGELLRLTGKGHLVEVVTRAGAGTVRIRLADAVAEIEPIPGYYVHRSHWVSRAAIADVEREQGRVYLKLLNGDRIPVSRKYRPDLEAAGIV